MLSGCIGDPTDCSTGASLAGNVDNGASPSLLPEDIHYRLAEPRWTGQIHGQLPLPWLLFEGVQPVKGVGDACDIAQDVDETESGQRTIHDCLGCAWLRNVTLMGLELRVGNQQLGSLVNIEPVHSGS